MNIRHFRQWSQARRAARKPGRAGIRNCAVEVAASRSGPPAIALASLRYVGDPHVAIEPLETECRVHPRGVEVRAWILVPEGDMPPRLADAIASSIVKLDSVSLLDRRIFYLSSAYGVALRDIATLLNVSRRQVRRAMLRAIAALDGKRA